jgi:hypothetical protein
VHSNSGKTVQEILKGKRASIKSAPLEEGSPSWEQIMNLTWEEIEENATNGELGFDTFKKLLGRKRFDK